MVLILLLMIISFFQFTLADQTLVNQAARVLDSGEYYVSAPSIIGDREWKELQLDRVVTTLDRTTTSFGKWGLKKLLWPISDKKQLLQRKKIITFLVDHPEDMRLFQKQLEKVRDVERSLLSYWDKNDVLNRSCEKFYFSMVGLHDLNKSNSALNISTFLEMFNSCERLLMTLALGGLTAEFSRWAYNESDKRTFSLLRGLKEGFSEPLRQHSPYLLKLKKSQSGYNDRDWTKAFLCEGSWGDRYTVMAKGMSKMIPGIAQANAAVCATIPTLFFDYKFGTTIVYTCRLIISMNSDLNELQRRVSAVAHGVDGLIKLRKILNHHSKELGDFFNEDDSNVDVLTKKLLSQRFLQKPGYFYSRGHVLVMHRELQHIKKSLIPMLRSVALLDAYCSLATLYKESQKEPVVFSFPKFIESPKPFVCYHNAWLPLLPFNEAITNDLVLGGDQPGKIIITGPNGGGKSTILKTYLATILAQSWCIIPAEYGEQTLFTSIKTGLAPHEDLEHGLSTFMAEKKTMSELLADITQSDENHHTLVLVDEPYKGTVDDESAKRIYQFGKDISAFDCALVAIATHVKKPIMLAYDTNGIFGNYQVKINEIYPGIFERLFKLEKGPAMWWFEDEDKRSRFIDWISVRAIS